MAVSVEYDRKVDEFFRGVASDLGREIVVGVLGAKASAGHGEEATMVDVATWMEFGIPGRVEPRSFLRDTLTMKQAQIVGQAHKEIRAYLLGKREARASWERIGLAVVGFVQQRIADGIPPELDQVTIDRKGSSVPLIDTGQLRSSITFEVRG